MTKEIAFIDHYDSFSFNLIKWLESCLAGLRVKRITCDDYHGLRDLADSPLPVVLSPGPGSPGSKIASLELFHQLHRRVPFLGVCLGHQIIAHYNGVESSVQSYQAHGQVIDIQRTDSQSAFFRGIPVSFKAMAYNSLAVISDPQTIPGVLAVCGQGCVQSIDWRFKEQNALGVQFHPESFLSDSCLSLVAENWYESL